MTSSVLLSDTPAPGVRQITLNRPDNLNTINAELCAALHEELGAIRADRSCRAVIVTGAGRGFCAGLDLHGYGEAPGNDGSDPSRDRLGNQEHMSRLVLALRGVPQPVIAAVNGPCAGFGLGLALGCDIRFAAAEAVFRVAFINIGVSNCDMGTSWLLPRLIGAAHSNDLLLTGRVADADDALRMGLVSRVVEPHELLATALDVAARMCEFSPYGLAMTKDVVWANLETASLDAAIEIEDRNQLLLGFTDNLPEAIRAFDQGRPPIYGDDPRRDIFGSVPPRTDG
jgi:enoyl-CoA hydratase